MELRNLNDEETEIYNSWLEAESVECNVKEEAVADIHADSDYGWISVTNRPINFFVSLE